MPRVIDCVVGPYNGLGLGTLLDLPKRTVFMHIRYDEQGAIRFYVCFGQLSFLIKGLCVVVAEVALSQVRKNKSRNVGGDTPSHQLYRRLRGRGESRRMKDLNDYLQVATQMRVSIDTGLHHVRNRAWDPINDEKDY